MYLTFVRAPVHSVRDFCLLFFMWRWPYFHVTEADKLLTVVGSNTTDGQRVSGQLHKNSSHSRAARAACDLRLWGGVIALLLNTSCYETLWLPFSPLVMVLLPEGLSTTPGLGARAACCPSCSIFQCFIWFREVW